MNRREYELAKINVTLKVGRAEHHIEEAKSAFRSYVDSDFCSITMQTNPQGFKEPWITAKKIPAEIPLAIGDAFHCMNASFDYVMTGLMRAKTGNAVRISFPSHDTRNQLRKSFMSPGNNARTPPNRRICEAFPWLAYQIMSRIQPYQGGNFRVWEVRQADNIDKHNIIMPSVTIVERSGMIGIDKVNNNISMNTGIVLHPGQSAPFPVSFGGDIELEYEGNPTVSITFPKTFKVFAGDPVFPTLDQCLTLTIEAISTIFDVIESKYF